MVVSSYLVMFDVTIGMMLAGGFGLEPCEVSLLVVNKKRCRLLVFCYPCCVMNLNVSDCVRLMIWISYWNVSMVVRNVIQLVRTVGSYEFVHLCVDVRCMLL